MYIEVPRLIEFLRGDPTAGRIRTDSLTAFSSWMKKR